MLFPWGEHFNDICCKGVLTDGQSVISFAHFLRGLTVLSFSNEVCDNNTGKWFGSLKAHTICIFQSCHLDVATHQSKDVAVLMNFAACPRVHCTRCPVQCSTSGQESQQMEMRVQKQDSFHDFTKLKL